VKWLWLVALAMVGLGCMPTVPEGGVRLAARPGRGATGLVVRLPASPSECQRQVLGIVRVSAPLEAQTELVAVLRHEAARLGGDRVVDIEYHREGDIAHMSGMAARCSQLMAGRDYLVVGAVAVEAPLASPEQAYAVLAEQARRRGARLLVNVDFERLQGSAFRLTGHVAQYVPRGWGTPGTDVPAPAPTDGPVTTWGKPKRRRAPAKPGVVCPPASTDGKGGVFPNLDQCRVRF
jgi:uncharacterized protein YbjQ (UPF0145 family)